ncbi:monosaccharide ABC transporter membrane protein, CUT2 family [Halopelagius longus]|uniref:Monosaccharide ABC transporter membrane protein, CUT2 family n=2 Tax=Halopelagius longus TaxID=1236180 RepID=A0A1H1FEL6_9EURY|nr:ABC transporter permease [Halopelagius longus]SDQ99405.1 monosaccharide ABC transporter membrane protein, CUT2 family [Halopelagius longus]
MSTTIGDGAREKFEQLRERRDLRDWLVDLGPFAMLIILVALFSFTSDVFATYGNFIGILNNSMILLLVALAGTFPILQQSIDLSVAALVGLTGVVTAMMVNQIGILAIPVGILVGVAAGTVNGVIFAKLKLPSFLVTLGTLSIAQGSALLLTDGSSIPFRNEQAQWVATGELIPTVPNLVLWGLLIYAITSFVAWKTSFGRYTYALGESEKVADLSGVKVDRYKIGVFVLSGLLCGIAGALLAARISSGQATMGDGFLLPSIAAIVMGGTALTGGVGGPHRTIIGVMVIQVLQNGLDLNGIGSFVQEIILGFVVIGAVWMSLDRDKIDVVK